MTRWYTRLGQDTPKDLRNERLAYFQAFYSNPVGMEVLANLRLHAGAWDWPGATVQEKALMHQTLDSFLAIIQEKAGVLDEYRLIQAEAHIAESTPIPTEEEDTHDGFNHDEGDYD